MFKLLFKITALIFIPVAALHAASPKGDNALIDLALASVTCAAVKKVNPSAVNDSYEDYLEDSITLYMHYHGYTREKAQQHQEGIYRIITGEPAVKAQSLNSKTGASRYIQKSLAKTDAENCSQIRGHASLILQKYNLSL